MKRTGEENRVTSEKAVRRTLGKTTIIFAVLFVLGVIGIIVVLLFVNKATSLVLEEDTYQYFSTTKVFHNTGVSLTNSEMSTILIEDKSEVGVDNTPMYTKDGRAIYLPESYSYCSVDNNSFWRIPEFMKLTRDANNNITCTFNDDMYEIQHGFLFDDNRNYIFIDSGKIYLNEYTTYQISPFSFFSKESDECFRIYNLFSDEFSIPDKDNTSTARFVSDSGYTVDLIRGVYTDKKGEEFLLVASPSLLSSIDKR